MHTAFSEQAITYLVGGSRLSGQRHYAGVVYARVLSAAGLNLQTLVNAFSAVGIEDAWVITNSSGDSIEPAQRTDIVIGIYDPSEPVPTPTRVSIRPGSTQFANLDVALRAGQAVGQGYPVFLLVPPPLPQPADLQGVVVARAPLHNYDALRLHLWAFVSTLPGRALLKKPFAADEPISFDANSVLEHLYAIDGQANSASLQVVTG